MKIKKISQNFENVKALEPLDDRELTRAIRDAIIAEENAIKQYEVIADSVADMRIKKIMQDLSDEERVHVGELQKILENMLEDEEDLVEEGKEEAEELLNDKED